MISANELRIGNWVETYMVMMAGSWIDKEGKQQGQDTITEPTIRAKQIDIEDLKIIVESKGFATYRPIPLTPDILIKAGYEIYKEWLSNKEGIVYVNKLTSTWVRDQKGTLRFVCPVNFFFVDISAPIHFLHQLQNVHHSLNQTELNISL